MKKRKKLHPVIANIIVGIISGLLVYLAIVIGEYLTITFNWGIGLKITTVLIFGVSYIMYLLLDKKNYLK